MKKYLYRINLAVLFSFLTIAVYFGCTDDETAAFFDLTGSWSGMAVPPNGAAFIDLDIVQDTAGNVTGTLYILSSDPDTATITGTVSNDHFTGFASDIECPADIDLDIENDGTTLVGHAVGQVSANCAADFVYLTLYKDVPATVNVTGSWNGTHTSTQDTGSFTMELNQIGETVSGELYDEDTTAIIGRVFGNVFEGTIGFSECPTLILMEVSSNSMNGTYANTGDGDCFDRGTVTANRSTGKVVKK
jgi:hypothetical protein